MPQHTDELRVLLCRLEDAILETVLEAQAGATRGQLSAIAAETKADTIFQIDKIVEGTVVDWMSRHWPSSAPVELVMEGIDDEALVFPAGFRVSDTKWKCIVDPIDGTRSWMHDKRSAWSLAAVAPQRGPETRLSDIVVAAMTELPVTKQWRADQLSAVRGEEVIAEAIDVRGGGRSGWRPVPAEAVDFRQGFAGVSKFFPQGKALLADLEEAFWAELHGTEPQAAPLVFDDQYVSTGGQLYELCSGRDRMWVDLRPQAFRKLGLSVSLTCHPYDICTAMILTELGGVVETPEGESLDAPLDTTSPISWVGYANSTLAALARPVLQRLVAERLAASGAR
ncbi:MAG: inositol monophosphatase [Acidobacteria bacterium]|nr:inositol monophosphatase [Acidobacteriota bacterium]MDA1233702.1 inositol monophosphatase [Acidobacteriota bacterium]